MKIWRAVWEPDGRISRTTFWQATLVLWAAGIVVWLVALGRIDPKAVLLDDLVRMAERAGLITSLILLYPSLAVAIKRLHDLGATGWWSVPLFVPGFVSGFLSLAEASELVEQAAALASLAVTLIYFATLGFLRGSLGPNQCGHDPRIALRAPPARVSARPERRQPANAQVRVRQLHAPRWAARIAEAA